MLAQKLSLPFYFSLLTSLSSIRQSLLKNRESLLANLLAYELLSCKQQVPLSNTQRLPGKQKSPSASAGQRGEEGAINRIMPKYVTECEMPGGGNMTPDELQGVSRTFCDVLLNLGPEIQWLHSYVTGDKIYCLYYAPGETLIREHARRSGFRIHRISEVKAVLDPATGER